MARDQITGSIADTVDSLSHQYDVAVNRSADLHRDGGADDVILIETNVAVRTAMALECLTGVSWEERLSGDMPHATEPEPAPPNRRSRFAALFRR